MRAMAFAVAVLCVLLCAGSVVAATWTHVGTSGFVVQTPSQIRDRKRVVVCDMVKDGSGNIWAAVSYSSDGGASPEPRSSGISVFKTGFASRIDLDLAGAYPGCVTKLAVGGDGAVYALQNYIHLEWSWEVVTSRILRLVLNPDDSISVQMIYSPGPANPWGSVVNRLGGMAVGGDGNVYWTQCTIGSTWRQHFFWRYDTASTVVEEAVRVPLVQECASETHKMLDLEYVGNDQFAIVGPYYNTTWQCSPVGWNNEPCVFQTANTSNPTWGRKWNTVNAYDSLRKKMWIGGRGEVTYYDWKKDSSAAGATVVDLGGGNFGLQFSSTDKVNKYYTDRPGIASAQETGAMRFRIDADSGSDRTIMWLYGQSSRTSTGNGLAVSLQTQGGRFKLVDLYPDAGGPTILADLGPVVIGAWNELYIYIDAEASTSRCNWNGSEVYNGPIGHRTGKNWLSWFEWGSDLSGVGASTITYDWVAQCLGYAAPGEELSKYWLYVDGSKDPTTYYMGSNIMSRFDGHMDNPTVFDSNGLVSGAKVWHANGYDELFSPVPGKRLGGMYWVQAMEINPYTGEPWVAWGAEPTYKYDAYDRVRTMPVAITGTKITLGDEGAPEAGSIVMDLLFDDDTSRMYALTCSPTTGVYNVYAADIAPPAPMSVASIKRAGAGWLVQTDEPKVVTYAGAEYFYIEDTDRTAGIKVKPVGSMPSLGETVNVSGMLDVVDNEAVILKATVTASGTGSVEPLAMPVKSLGGVSSGVQPATDPAYGLNTVGLLVRVAGKCYYDFAEGGYMLDDGSGQPIRVDWPNLPLDPSVVAVTGVLGLEGLDTTNPPDGKYDKYRRVLWVREEADVQVQQ